MSLSTGEPEFLVKNDLSEPDFVVFGQQVGETGDGPPFRSKGGLSLFASGTLSRARISELGRKLQHKHVRQDELCSQPVSLAFRFLQNR
jgi:hypothetical protein